MNTAQLNPMSSDRFSQFRVWLRPRRVLVGFASSCCPAPPQFWASFSCWPPSLFAIHSEQKRPLAVARDRSYFRFVQQSWIAVEFREKGI
ncbi:hypothetical protein TNCV_4357641 [Trichonephila clavipes]|nr:hypothetical protein TNCV_4357641 [Trichonephila clavipes]